MSGYVRGAGSAGQPSCPPELAPALEVAKPLHEPARCGRVVLTAAARLAMSALLRVRVWGQRAGQVWGRAGKTGGLARGEDQSARTPTSAGPWGRGSCLPP